MKSKQPRPQKIRGQGGNPPTRDSISNFMARTGVNNADNLSSASTYQTNFTSRNRQILDSAYRSSWIVGQAVDTVAEDMTREGVEIVSGDNQDDIERIEEVASDLGVWDSLCQSIKWARLYGGCLAYLMIDGQKPETPLRLDTITEGQFKGVLPLDRWMVSPSESRITDLSPDMGKPEYYNVTAQMPFSGKRIHHSRVIRFDGVTLPFLEAKRENSWGQSVIERLWDRLVAFDSTTQGAAQLVFKAHLRTYKVDGFRELVATGGKPMEALVKQLEMVRLYQSNEGLTLMDAKDTFEAHQYSFSGLSDLMLQFGQQLSGAIQVPLVRLFGQSPSGMNSSGESDLRTYYDGIAKNQNRDLRKGVNVLYDVIARSSLGRPLAKGAKIKFKPLWLLSENERAMCAQTVTGTVLQAEEAGIIDRATALSELKASSEKTGVFTNITDEMIERARQEPTSNVPNPQDDEAIQRIINSPQLAAVA